MASDEKIGELIQAIENLRGAVKALTDEVFAMRGALSKPPKPSSTGILNHMKQEHQKKFPKK